MRVVLVRLLYAQIHLLDVHADLQGHTDQPFRLVVAGGRRLPHTSRPGPGEPTTAQGGPLVAHNATEDTSEHTSLVKIWIEIHLLKYLIPISLASMILIIPEYLENELIWERRNSSDTQKDIGRVSGR